MRLTQDLANHGVLDFHVPEYVDSMFETGRGEGSGCFSREVTELDLVGYLDHGIFDAFSSGLR
jgi:hypothetical protein